MASAMASLSCAQRVNVQRRSAGPSVAAVAAPCAVRSSKSAFVGARVQARAAGPVAARASVQARAAVADAKGKKIAVITGASSGLGLNAAKSITDKADWHVVMAVRDYAKAEKAARDLNMDPKKYTIMHLDLASFASVRAFVDAFKATGLPLNTLVANAAVYLPTAKEPTFTADGFEISVATNHLGHFLLCNLLLDTVAASDAARMIIVGSVTGNTNTLAGNIPPKADLGELQGLKAGFKEPVCMIDGGEFDGAKAYKDSKVCNMLTMREFNKRFAGKGVTFASLYPGCIADTGLFRNHFQLFRDLFPKFQKYVTKGYVSQEEAGRRLCAVATDPQYKDSGAYWSWSGEGASGSFVNTPSAEVQDGAKGELLWELSEKLTGLKSAVSA